MQVELVTKDDLEAFKNDLLRSVQAILNNQKAGTDKEYLRSKEVRQLLGLSNGSLQNLRVKGLLHPTKIEGTYYYKLSEIKTLLDAGSE